MFQQSGSFRAKLTLRARLARTASTLLILTLIASAAQAVVVRGRVTDALGAPIPGSRVNLVEDGQVVAFALSDPDGMYEVRYSGGGRYTLIGLSPLYLPSVGVDFYGGTTDVLQHDIVLATNTVQQEISGNCFWLSDAAATINFTGQCYPRRVDFDAGGRNRRVAAGARRVPRTKRTDGRCDEPLHAWRPFRRQQGAH